MRRCFRSLIALVAAYDLLFGALFGSIASANSAGSGHFALCLAGTQSGGDPAAPANPRDYRLCCLVCAGSGESPVLTASEIEAIAPASHRVSPWRSFMMELPSSILHGVVARAPPFGA